MAARRRLGGLPQERRGGVGGSRRRPRPDGRHRPLTGQVRAECFQRIRRGSEPVEHARHHRVRRRRGHRGGGLLLHHDEVPVAGGWMRVREGGRRGNPGRGRSPDGGRADGQDVRRGRGLRARTSRAAAVRTRGRRQVPVWILAEERGPPPTTTTRRARTDPSSSRSTTRKTRRTRKTTTARKKTDPRLPHSRREGSAWRSPWRRGPGRNATGDWPAWSSSPRLERRRTARSRFESALPRTRAAARRGRHRHRGVARGPGRHVSDVRIAVGRRGVRPELRRRASR